MRLHEWVGVSGWMRNRVTDENQTHISRLGARPAAWPLHGANVLPLRPDVRHAVELIDREVATSDFWWPPVSKECPCVNRASKGVGE